jgi:hypothetical protein
LKEFDGAGQSKGEFLLNGKILQLDTTEDFLIALTPHELITIDVNNLTAIVQRTTLKTPAFNFTLSEGFSLIYTVPLHILFFSEGVNAIVQNTANSLASYDVTR